MSHSWAKAANGCQTCSKICGSSGWRAQSTVTLSVGPGLSPPACIQAGRIDAGLQDGSRHPRSHAVADLTEHAFAKRCVLTAARASSGAPLPAVRTLEARPDFVTSASGGGEATSAGAGMVLAPPNMARAGCALDTPVRMSPAPRVSRRLRERRWRSCADGMQRRPP